MYLPKIRQLIAKYAANSAGFTMIELLVVISVIGVLAVAVLSSINPIEQINKGRDTRTRSDAAQLVNAIDRYVAIHEEYPWNTLASTAFDVAFTMNNNEWNTAADDWADLLVSTSEVKDSFIARQVSEQALFVFKPIGYDSNVTTCFVPASNAFRQEAAQSCDGVANGGAPFNTLCATNDGTVPTSGAAQNYICVPALN